MKLKFASGVIIFTIFIVLSLACATTSQTTPPVVYDRYFHNTDKDLFSGIHYVVSTTSEFSDSVYSKVDKMHNEYTIQNVLTKLEWTEQVKSPNTGLYVPQKMKANCHTDLTIKLTDVNSLDFEFSNPRNIPSSNVVNYGNWKSYLSDIIIKNAFNYKLKRFFDDPELYNNISNIVENEPAFIFLTAEQLTAFSLKSYIESLANKSYTSESTVDEVNDKKNIYNKAYYITAFCGRTDIGNPRMITYYTNDDKLAYSRKGEKIKVVGKIKDYQKEILYQNIDVVEE